jgi:hypothetical protein
MSKEEPDNIPVSAEHVRAFLGWYRKRSELSEILLNVEWWHNALSGLTLGELRNGIRAYQRFTSKLALTPPEFWKLCKGQQDEAALVRFRELRKAVLNKQKGDKP